MKKLLMVLISGIITLTTTAQTINLTFNGTNNVRNYQVVLDGTSYYSNSATSPNSNTSVKKEVTLSNQQLGSHSIEVYRLRNNSGTYNNGTNTTPNGRAVYTNTFQLREGYDMNIAINGNGQVTFTEKRVRNQGRRGNNQVVNPIDDATYDQIVQSVRSSWSQPSRVTKENAAFNNTAYYFTTSQVRGLLLLISSEANRLALAKRAYPRVSDPGNFTQLYDVFNSVASRNDLNTFIANNPNYNNTRGNNSNNNNNNTTFRTPMADYQFSQLLQTVNSQYNQSGKYTTIGGAFNNSANWFTTAQIRQLLSVINSESDKLTLAKQSFLRVSDPANFSTLYDLFNSQDSRNDLNNYVIQNGGSSTYNNSNTYRTAMADYQFSQLLQTTNSQYSQSGKYSTISGAFNNSANWFSTSQIRQLLSVINAESDRLTLAKQSYLRVSDPANFSTLYDLLYSQASRNDLNNYVIQNGGTSTYTNPNAYRTPMADYQFSQLVQTVNNQYNQSGKYTTINGSFNNSANWFTTAQVKQLISLITAESDRLTLAKQSYLRVSDPANFSTLYDLLYSQASRNDLNNYVIQNGGTITYNNPQYTNRTPMADATFSQVLQKVKGHFRSSSRVTAVKEALNNTTHYYSTSQIRQLLMAVTSATVLLSSENDIFELAKLGWNRVSDPANFTQLYDLFKSQAHIDALNAYIQANPLQ